MYRLGGNTTGGDTSSVGKIGRGFVIDSFFYIQKGRHMYVCMHMLLTPTNIIDQHSKSARHWGATRRDMGPISSNR